GLYSPYCARQAENRFNYSEVEARITRRDFAGLTKHDLATPALVLDEGLFQQNLQRMAEHTKTSGLKLPPHAKVHKCPDICKRQLTLGAIGVSCATTAECELMMNAGIRNVLHTSQPASRNQISRTVNLAHRDTTFIGVLEDPLIVDALEEALGGAH